MDRQFFVKCLRLQSEVEKTGHYHLCRRLTSSVSKVIEQVTDKKFITSLSAKFDCTQVLGQGREEIARAAGNFGRERKTLLVGFMLL
jgi:hypothetical protein